MDPLPSPGDVGRRRLLIATATGAVGWTVPAVLSTPALAQTSPGGPTTTSPPPPFVPVGVAPEGQARWMAVDASGSVRLSTTIAATMWIVATPTGGATVDLTGTTQLGFWALLGDGTVRRSVDQGVTWVDVPAQPGVADAVAIDAHATSAVVVSASGDAAVTTDGGVTWETVAVPGLGTIVDVAWDALGGIVVVDSAGAGARSTDAGLNWTALPSPLGLAPVALDRAREYYVAVAADGSAVLFDPVADNGPDDLADVDLPGEVVEITATGGISPSGRRYLVVDDGGRVAISTDDGVTWTAAATIT